MAVPHVITVLRGRALYLSVAFTIPALAALGHAVAPGQAVFKGQDLGIVIDIAATMAAVLLWIPFQASGRWPRHVFLFLAVVSVAWLYEICRIQWDQSVFNETIITVPIVLGLIASKRASQKDLDLALTALAYSLIAISVISLIFGSLGMMPNGFRVSDAGNGRVPLLDLIGVPNRWGGPFESVNYAAPIGGLLIVIGASRRGWNRWLILIGGFSILLLGQARTAMFATVAGLLVLAMWRPVVRKLRHAAALRWIMVGAALLLVLLYVVIVDPSFSGRTPIWADFWALWHKSPIFGIGDSGVRAYMDSRVGTGLVTHSHAHSVLLDALARYGVVLALLTLLIFSMAIWSSVRTLKLGDSFPLAMTVFIILAGSAETLHSWRYWTVYSACLVWVILRGARTANVSVHGDAKPLTPTLA